MPTEEELQISLMKANLDLQAATASLKTTESSLNTLKAENETLTTNLTTSATSLRELTDASKSSTKNLDELKAEVEKHNTTIATQIKELEEFTTLKTSNAALQASVLEGQKTRLKALGIGDELLTDKDGAALTAMESAIAAVGGGKSNGTIKDPGNAGLAGGGDGVVNDSKNGLDFELEQIKKAKERIGIKE